MVNFINLLNQQFKLYKSVQFNYLNLLLLHLNHFRNLRLSIDLGLFRAPRGRLNDILLWAGSTLGYSLSIIWVSRLLRVVLNDFCSIDCLSYLREFLISLILRFIGSGCLNVETEWLLFTTFVVRLFTNSCVCVTLMSLLIASRLCKWLVLVRKGGWLLLTGCSLLFFHRRIMCILGLFSRLLFVLLDDLSIGNLSCLAIRLWLSFIDLLLLKLFVCTLSIRI